MRIATAFLVALAVVALPASAGAATTIELGDDFFKPASKRVGKGTKVRFRWIGNRPHNVTKVRGPGGSFASRTTSRRGVNFVRRFRRSGTYRMVCTIHPGQMRLKLVVR